MHFEPGSFYHIYNRGNNREKIFYSRANYLYFMKKAHQALEPYSSTLAWCLMPNHFHYLVRTNDDNFSTAGLSRNIGIWLRSYTRAINRQEGRTGSLFQQHTKAKELASRDGNYPLVCFHYIHYNPIKAGLVNKLEDWEFSSYREYYGLRESRVNINLARELNLFGDDLIQNPVGLVDTEGLY